MGGHTVSGRREERALVLGYTATLIVFVGALIERVPYDDSYFFKRIALNFLRRGVLAWNLEEGPVHGLTSQSFGLLAVVVTALARDYYVVAVRAVLVLCLVSAYALLVRLSAGADRGTCASVACCSPVLAFTVLSGMETALAVLVLCALLWALFAERTPRPWMLAPALVVLVYLTRPDALLLALPLLCVSRLSRGSGLLRDLALVAAGLCLILAACSLYYGSALPLPFYAKSAAFSAYDAEFRQLSEHAGTQRLALFLVVALPLAALGALKRDAINAALLGGCALHAAYHCASTIDVMGMHGRFYAPALPLLALAASRGFAGAESSVRLARSTLAVALAGAWMSSVGCLGALGALPRPGDTSPDGVPAALYGSMAISMLLLLTAFGTRREGVRRACAPAVFAVTAAAAWIAFPYRGAPELSDDAYLARHSAAVTSFRGMDALRRCLGDSIHVYHSEIGVTGLRFPNGRVTDLVGLLSPRWLFREQSFDTLCSAEQPEAIFLPHASYRALNREITAGECLRGYARVVERSSSPLFVRKDQLERYIRCESPVTRRIQSR